MRKARVALALALAVVAGAPTALAQKGTKPKSDTKTETKTTAPASPSSSSSSSSDTSAAAPTTTTAASSSDSSSIPQASPDAVGVGANGEKVEPAKTDITDVTEKSGQTYYYIGLRYGGTIIPKFMLNLFVDEGGTFYSNNIGVEVDIRKDGFSIIPSLSYSEYGTGGPVLFKEKSKPDIEQNWSVVDSSLKALWLGADLLWSTNVSKNIDIEYGAGFGIGVIFGDLVNNWVYQVPNGTPGALHADSNNKSYRMCQSATDGAGCVPTNHTNPTPPHLGGYTEPSWINGGSKPNFYPRILLHLIGLRFKPIKEMEGRVGLGFSLTEGFWFGLSADYGLERPEKKTSSSSGPTLRWN